jgi:hypothetical protein
MKTEWHDLIQQYISGTLPDTDAQSLEETLKNDPIAADLYLSYINLDVTLEAQSSSRESISQLLSSLPLATDTRPQRSALWRSVMAAAAGLVLGLFSASLLFAYATPQAVVTASRLLALVDGDFEGQPERISSGFPSDFGVWSGDEAGVVQGRRKGGGRALCFTRAQGDAAAPHSPAESCDVFQLVDLRALRGKADGLEDTFLELSADFLDGRAEAGTSVRFGCHLYLFSGRPEALQSSWPAILREAVGYGVGGCITEGGGGTEDWRRVTARCFLPPNADFAVVQVACGRPRGETREAPELGRQLADNVTLTLKTQPKLPVRLLQQ